MEPIQIDGIVKSITFLKAGADGRYECERLTESGSRKKQSKVLKPMERLVRKLVKSELAAAQTYLERHEQSNRRKSNGWLKNMGKNLKQAAKSARKSAKPPKLTVVR
ncbi:hypothetical protein [Methylogaea oryzae]|uniref:Uncharacterized protein n=1 Tax=Methylogaea oryzae TaxID=1295382 RepID=A0A8D4VPG9_9GAMM|nr:hypothetical protein [Methylogaea oryzae]BBL71302.1 hypothetical protein MoryE10_19080 [Methylogaea oryzae]